MLGARPTEMAPRAQPQVQTCNSLDPLLSELSNTLVEIEYLVPSPSPDAVLVKRNAPAIAPPAIPYFCVPRNDKLMAYWTTVGERLFKIRHGMNIEGVARQLALFEPPIDPGLLVRAAAAGVDLGSVLNDMNAPLPSYRFQVMAQKATELVRGGQGAGRGPAVGHRETRRGGARAAAVDPGDRAPEAGARGAQATGQGSRRERDRSRTRETGHRGPARLLPEHRSDQPERAAQPGQAAVRARVAEPARRSRNWSRRSCPLIGDFDLGASGWGSSSGGQVAMGRHEHRHGGSGHGPCDELPRRPSTSSRPPMPRSKAASTAAGTSGNSRRSWPTWN